MLFGRKKKEKEKTSYKVESENLAIPEVHIGETHEEEPEPELSVDALLAATSDNDDENLEDIGYSEKSETRKLIEKFVDENPDAAALLLRNWLNDDWE